MENIMNGPIPIVCASAAIGICTGVALGHFWPKRGDYLSTENYTDIGTEELKLVLVVQNGLKMNKGKIAAQCSHASVLSYKLGLKNNPGLIREWEGTGQRKVVVKVEDEKALLDIASQAHDAGLIVSAITDAGRTQIPAGSKTVVGVGPGPADVVDKITGHLKLL